MKLKVDTKTIKYYVRYNVQTTRRHVPQDCFLQSHSRKNIKSYRRNLSQLLVTTLRRRHTYMYIAEQHCGGLNAKTLHICGYNLQYLYSMMRNISTLMQTVVPPVIKLYLIQHSHQADHKAHG
jgi:hypothetical protein